MIRSLAILFGVVLWVSACGGDPGEEGGLIGTGIIGTVSENKLLASESVEIKASTGQKITASLNRNRRYAASDLTGSAPYLVRSDLGNGEYRYAIAYEKGTASNVHSYSDVALRYWFEGNNLNKDSEFNSDAPLASLPSQQEFDRLSSSIFSIVDLVLKSYEVTGEQLLSAVYNANDRGIDRYLDKNPVVIEGRVVNILVTDPTTQIQSTTQAGLALGAAIPAAGEGAGTSSPTRVGNVRALGSRLDEIVVVWDPSTDDIGVVAYQVRRDGNLVATTPYPVYTDTGLQPGNTYSYEITAIDGDANSSPASSSVAATTLSSVDNNAPPAPTRVNAVEITPSRVELQWSQSAIGDVVAFNIYRGVAGQTIELLIKSTSTGVIDPSVSGGTNYCYRISALDASGNESELSELLCVDTAGDAISSSGSSGTLNVPNTDAVSCTAVLPASITEDTTLTEQCYLANDDIQILNFADVVVPAGTIIKFAQGVGLDVTTNASLSVNGTLENPVVFTGQEDVIGFWRGVEYVSSFSENNQIVNAVIEYAGSGSNAALTMRSFLSARGRLRVRGSLIQKNRWFGVAIIGLGAQIDAFDGNTLTENRQPASFGPLVLPSIGSGNSMTGNELDRVTVSRLTLNEDLAIPNFGVPIRSDGLTMSRAELTIDAGVEIVFNEGVGLFIVEGGNLIVNGTLDNPVLLTADVANPGRWGGVHLTDSTDSRLSGLTIEYGGAPVARFNANLAINNSTVSLNDVSLNNSSGYGYFADENSQVNLLGDVQQNNNALQ